MKITKSELREIIQEVADEMGLFEGLTAAQEKLPEPLKKAILKKQGNSSDSEETEEKEDVEEGLTAAQEKLPEPLKKAILKKQGNSDDSSDEEEKEDVEESIEEGNAFGAAVKAARDNGDSEFQVGGKTYQLKEKVTEEVEDTEEFTGEDEEELEEGVCETCDEDDEDVEEGNAFGDAVAKAKESGETEFEVGGKTYKVRENWSKITLSEKLDRILGNRKVL
jgi:hypothetical protein